MPSSLLLDGRRRAQAQASGYQMGKTMIKLSYKSVNLIASMLGGLLAA